MKVDIGLSEESRKGVVGLLNVLLSDEFTLYTKTRNYHWNIVVSQFHELHLFLETQYEELAEIMDQVAERNRMIGGHAMGTMEEFKEHSRIKEQPGQYPTAMKMIENLLHDHESIIKCIRTDLETCQDKYKDAGTTDFLTGLMQQHEKNAWMLRSTLEGQAIK
ncbi:MAG: DNA starvation/stationary phase protection protein [Candidatus Sericytochromatia bacterium]|nr:DNA starvation/stationary phase protection protein [Candidatus Sericytochromatia bacterium]